jgi:hypothetical protein
VVVRDLAAEVEALIFALMAFPSCSASNLIGEGGFGGHSNLKRGEKRTKKEDEKKGQRKNRKKRDNRKKKRPR